ncbi:hypothetical protein RFEPED_1228 [Rickettsia felis str. Pedreira]|uniref:Uncharacterized protein n=1 Tax=Rickettsia felis str. Pedreira TaxID=1359196 RepID=A0A0F3MSX1_RICFI|nr:hypothetical protein [Rickettsia felis]KJV58835.1 hypothetical protein RFEPED_1228 [Rickettsia felis str. Pedreira]
MTYHPQKGIGCRDRGCGYPNRHCEQPLLRRYQNRHCEERSDVAISGFWHEIASSKLTVFPRNDVI